MESWYEPANANSSKKPWSGGLLRVTGIHYPPYNVFLYDENGTFIDNRVNGSLAGLLAAIVVSMNMTMKIKEPRNYDYGTYLPNGTYTGTLADVFDQVADIAIGPFQCEDWLYKDFYFTPVMTITPVIILTGMHRAYETRPVVFIEFFDEWTWRCLWLLLIVMYVLFVIEPVIAGKRKRVSLDDMHDILFRMLQTLLQEGTKNRFMRLYTRILGGTLIVCTMVLMILFTSDSKTNMVIQIPTLRVENIDQVNILSKKRRLFYPMNTPITDLLRGVPGERGRILNESLVPENQIIMTSINDYFNDTIMDIVSDEKGIFFCDEYSTMDFIKQRCPKTDRYFYFGYGDYDFPPFVLVSLLLKSLPKDFTTEFNMRFHWLQAYGVPFEVPNYGTHLNCVPGRTAITGETNQLSFEMVESVFMSWLVMISGSCIVLFLEIITHKMFLPKKTQRNKHFKSNA